MERIKKILIAGLIAISIWLIGYVAGVKHFREATKMFQIDTVVRYDTVRYTKFELSRNTCKLDLPNFGKLDLVYIPADSTTIIYKESVRYVTLPRENFYTKLKDAEIWHSGIDSRIDSLNIFSKAMVISKTETTTLKPSPWRYAISVGLDYGWMWQNYISPNIGAEIEYKRVSLGIECGLSINMVDNVFQTPELYLQAGIKYRIAGR